MKLLEYEEMPLGLTQMVEKEWEGIGVGEASDLLQLLTQNNDNFYPFAF